MLWMVWTLALANGGHLEASRDALQRWLGPGQPAEALDEARREARLATQEARDDADAWLHATRVLGMAAATGEGDLSAVGELVDAARRAADLGVPPARISQELQKVSLKLTRLSLKSTMASRDGTDAGQRSTAYAWARRAYDLDRLAEELGGKSPDQHASTLAVLAGAALDADKVDEAFEHYEAMRALGHNDAGLARTLATHRAATDLDGALNFLAVDLEKGQDFGLVELQADLLLKADRPADAVASILPHQAVYENDPELWVLLGGAHAAAGQMEEAREALDRCLAFAPDDVDCLWARGRVPYRQGRAITVVTAGGGKKKKSAGFQQQRKLYREALEFLENAHELDANHLDVNAALVTIYTALEDKSGLERLTR